MLVNVLSVLALSAVTFASPALRAPLEFGPSEGVGSRPVARGDYDYKDKDYKDKDYKNKDYDHKDYDDKYKDDKWDDKDCVKGYLKLTTYDGKDFGYVGKETTWYGAYTRANHDEEKLIVEINESFDTWGAFNIKTLNGLDPWKPYFSGIVGYASTSDDISKGSYNYFFLGGAKWPAGASAQPVENILHRDFAQCRDSHLPRF
ncbi:hypothetical protein CPB85DRAFT_656643 [Mucidula mucida]|nr:hypothetical protein CPB85DRAFT_656643 [Mucidula mucida]